MIASVGCILCFCLRALPPKKWRIFRTIVRVRHYPTISATSHRGSSARYDGDTGYVIIDVFLLRHSVATRGRGCRPQHVNFLRNKLTRSDKALASTASPNGPIPSPLAPSHLQLDGQCPKQAHCCGRGCFHPTREVIIILLYLFLFYFYCIC